MDQATPPGNLHLTFQWVKLQSYFIFENSKVWQSPSLGSGTQHVPVSKTSINTLNKVTDHTPNTQSASSIARFH